MRGFRAAASALGVFSVALLGAVLVAGCGSSGSGGSSTTEVPGNPAPTDPTDPAPTDPTDPTDPAPTDPVCDETFDSTYDAIQSAIFEGKGCTAEACHGGASAGGLDLRAEVSYGNLFDTPSTASSLSRVHPGAKDRSFLWLKLLAATDESIEIAGSPMPLGATPLGTDELDLVRLWIQAGAPEAGTVLETDGLVDGCLPEPEPILIEPLPPPAPGEGVQLEMPAFLLEAASETEVCFPTYYDFTDVVPDEFKSPDGNLFWWEAFEIRQDPASHHLLVQAPIAAFGGSNTDPGLVEGWACLDGANEGDPCDPLDEGACGAGTCAGPVRVGTGCSGYEYARSVTPITFTGTQQPQYRRQNHPGVYAPAPIKGLVFWNSHAFNLTTSDTRMHARVNWLFARDRTHPIQTYGGGDNNFGISRLIVEGAAPYTEKVMCGETILPRGARLTGLNSHTHKRGKRFWYEAPDGEILYESLVYNDPLDKQFDPPLEFDSEDTAERTITFCSLYNNGVDEAGDPDPETVTRASRIPYGVQLDGLPDFVGLCEPSRCVNEGARFDVNCDDRIRNQAGDDAVCDSAPGAGDGFCDACNIMGGVTTENEMFGPDISYFVVELE